MGKIKAMKNIIKITLAILFIAMMNSCVSVKSYQKMYINDEDMKLANRKIQQPELDFQVYREGASGANGGKTGGGCGCN